MKGSLFPTLVLLSFLDYFVYSNRDTSLDYLSLSQFEVSLRWSFKRYITK